MTQDDKHQSAVVNHFFETHNTKATYFYLNSIVLCELVWVLESAYQYKKKQISHVLELLIRNKQFVVDDYDAFWCALSAYRDRGHDFADYLLGALNTHYGCRYTVTLDKKASKSNDFQYLQ